MASNTLRKVPTRDASSSKPAPDHRRHSAFERKALLKLAAASDAGQFWRAAQALLARAAPSPIRWLCLRPIGMATAMLLLRETSGSGVAGRSDNDECDAALLKELFARHPAILHFGTKSGQALVRLSGDECLLVANRAEHWPRLKQARFGIALAFWRRRKIQGILLLHRSEADGDFSTAEFQALRELHSHLETALNRIITTRAHQAQKHLLGGIFKPFPTPLLLCDWQLKIICESAAGSDARAAWEFGEQRARQLKRSARRVLPAELANFCGKLIKAWETADPAGRAALESMEKEVSHPHAFERRAAVRLVRLTQFPLIKPFFLFRFNASRFNRSDASDARFLDRDSAALAQLSACERELTLLVCEGHSNARISREMGKSVHTVKAQLHSIFVKLRVKSRAKLIALLVRTSSLLLPVFLSDISAAMLSII